MKTTTHALHSAAQRLSALNRRRTLGVVVAAVGAISMSIGLISMPAAADESYVCPAGNYLSWTDTFDPPASVVTVPNFDILYIGFGLVGGGHVTFGDGTSMRGDTIDVVAAIGEPATDAHWCKAITDETTTTVEETTTTVEETTTTVEETTTTVEETTTTATPTTTPGETAPTTTVGEETTTTQPEEVTTTTDSESGGPTTTTPVEEVTTTTDSASLSVTTTIATELPRTGPDEVRAFMTFGALMMLMGGVLVLRSRRDVEFA